MGIHFGQSEKLSMEAEDERRRKGMFDGASCLDKIDVIHEIVDHAIVYGNSTAVLGQRMDLLWLVTHETLAEVAPHPNHYFVIPVRAIVVRHVGTEIMILRIRVHSLVRRIENDVGVNRPIFAVTQGGNLRADETDQT